MEQENYEAGRAMDMKAWFARVLWNWKLVLFVMLIGGVIGAGLAYLKNRDVKAQLAQAAAEEVETEADYDKQLEDVRGRLTAVQISKINGLVNQYMENVVQREKLSDTYRNMYVMQMDPTEAVVRVTQFSVESSSVDIGLMLCNLTISEEHSSEIREILGAGDEAALDNLVRLSRDTGDNSAVMSDENNYNSVVTLQIVANTKEEADSIYQVMETQLSEVEDELHGKYKNFTVTEVGSAYPMTASTTVANLQYDLVNRLNTVSSQFVNIENSQIKSLTGDEALYFNLLVSAGSETVAQIAKVDSAATAAAEEETVPTEVSYAGYFGGGLLAGFAVWLVVSLIVYAASGHVVKTADTIPGVLTVRIDERLKKLSDPIRRKAVRMEDPDAEAASDIDAQLQIAASRIRYGMEHQGVGSVFIYTDAGGELISRASDGLGALLPDLKIETGDPSRDSVKMGGFLESDGLVLLESAERTKAKNAVGAALMGREHNKTILCSVLCYEGK